MNLLLVTGFSIFMSYFVLLMILLESVPSAGESVPVLGKYFSIDAASEEKAMQILIKRITQWQIFCLFESQMSIMGFFFIIIASYTMYIVQVNTTP